MTWLFELHKTQPIAHAICVLAFVCGVLKRSEFAAEQSAIACKIETGSKPLLLVILENFEGLLSG